MGGLYLLLPTFLVIIVSFLIVRGAAIALMMTGMTEQRARFQALSAFSGTGFTTREAEIVVNHPQRRQIMIWLMILGNAGIVTVIVSATSSIVVSEGFQIPITILVLIAGIYLVYKLVSRQGLVRRWEKFIENRILKLRTFGDTTTEDLFLLMQEFGLMRVIVTENSLLLDRSFLEEALKENTLFIQGIERGNRWISLPKADEILEIGDRVIIYGRLPELHKMLKKK